MSEDWRTGLSRRPLLAALGALVGIGVAGGAVYEGGHVLFHSTPKGPYGDLLIGLGDADTAARVGRAALTGMPGFRASAVAGRLRGRLAGKPLSAVLVQDAAEGRVDEVEDWVLPRTLTELCALAASQ